MNDSIIIVFKVVPVILLMALGVFFEKTGFISKDAINGMKKLVVNFSLPSLLFLAFLRTELKQEYALISLVVFITCLIGFAMGFLFKVLQRNTNQFYPALFSSFVTGMVGYSLFISVFGTEQLYKLAVIDIGNALFVFIVLVNFLDSVKCDRTASKRLTLKDLIINMVKSPLIIGIVLGILISLSGSASYFQTSPATAALTATVTMIANTTVPIIMLVIGYELHFDLKNLMAPVFSVLLRLIMMITFAYILNTFVVGRILGPDKMFQIALYTLFILPPAYIIPVFITGECAEKSFTLNFLSIHLIFSIIAFIVLMAVIR
jgi:predicted permease